MNKILLIAQREFLNRVQKKSFLVATILLPLIFPAIMAVMVYVAKEQRNKESRQVIYYIDENGIFNPEEVKKFDLRLFNGPLDEAKKAFSASEDFGLLYIPAFDLSRPIGISLFTKVNPSPSDIGALEAIMQTQIQEQKMIRLNIGKSTLDSLKTNVSIQSINLSASGEEKSMNTKVLFGVGMAGGILIYIFIFVYGAQIMQGVIEEKTSKVVEVIISSVKPFQLMMGKILGLASVGLLQFLIWIVLITTLSNLVMGYFGFDMPQKDAIEQMGHSMEAADNPEFLDVMQTLGEIPVVSMVFIFLFFFLGGYLMYGALFAAVGSAVDSPAEVQQFIFPITIPMLVSYFALFTFILDDPHGTISIWLSIIPFTSPIAMMGRVGFGVPPEQMLASMVSLIAGFVLTTWMAARIYRVGILMHGTKVSYKVLAKWFMMRG